MLWTDGYHDFYCIAPVRSSKHLRDRKQDCRSRRAVDQTAQIGDATLDTIRDSVGLNFQSMVQNVRTLKQNDPILQQYPDIHRNWKVSISYRDSLTHESFTLAPIQWDHVADSVYDDLPVMKSSIIVALRGNGIANL
ncbi:hypothetical protein PILCRDRAFT_595944 [Piloderma croceum F 1598]|uniref:Uncharacterized protein n=1 Tax=Piloderma croceum (strain F 1598) TaxID=765440 RepID=A0A0C3AWF7_PILCF|nr:hypothetical protein PILCRDRAFT_595944 [Piloderma croceum F 1598]